MWLGSHKHNVASTATYLKNTFPNFSHHPFPNCQNNVRMFFNRKKIWISEPHLMQRCLWESLTQKRLRHEQHVSLNNVKSLRLWSMYQLVLIIQFKIAPIPPLFSIHHFLNVYITLYFHLIYYPLISHLFLFADFFPLKASPWGHYVCQACFAFQEPIEKCLSIARVQ